VVLPLQKVSAKVASKSEKNVMSNFTFDSLFNFVAGLGTAKDKSTSSRYVINQLSVEQLSTAYRSDWVARKVVTAPAQDATREWRAWQADEDQITLIEKLERDLDIQRKLFRALVKARLYGGAALIMGIDGAGEPDEELKLERVKEGSLKYVHVLTRHEIAIGSMITDVMSDLYGEPEYYTVSSLSLPALKIHPSRVIRLLGAEIPMLSESDGWSDSCLQAVDDAIKNVGLCSGGIAAMVWEAKVDIIKIPNLMESMATAEYQRTLIERFTLANTAKSMVNALLLDKEEEWTRMQQSFSGMPEILQEYLHIASGAADIPATRLLGQSPKGLNATGQSDTRNYYDMVRSTQKTELTPTLSRLDEVLIRSALGDRPKEIHYEWRPLWQMNETEKAALAYQKAQAHKIDVDNGLILEDALAQGRINQLIEDGFYPGFEQAIKDAKEAAAADLDETDPQIIAQNKALRGVEVANPALTPPPVPGAKPGSQPEGTSHSPIPSSPAATDSDYEEWTTWTNGGPGSGPLLADYNPDQPRDPSGKFAEGGGTVGKEFKNEHGRVISEKEYHTHGAQKAVSTKELAASHIKMAQIMQEKAAGGSSFHAEMATQYEKSSQYLNAAAHHYSNGHHEAGRASEKKAEAAFYDSVTDVVGDGGPGSGPQGGVLHAEKSFTNYDELKDLYDAVQNGTLTDGVTLTEDEDKAIRAVVGGTASWDINNVLRGVNEAGFSGEQADIVSNLDSAMGRSSLSQDQTLFRQFGYGFDMETAAKGKDIQNQIENMKPGDIFTDKGFMSTSAIQHRPDDMLVKILAPAGTKALVAKHTFNEMDDEKEIILDRGTRLEYLGKNDRGTHVLRVKSQTHDGGPGSGPHAGSGGIASEFEKHFLNNEKFDELISKISEDKTVTKEDVKEIAQRLGYSTRGNTKAEIIKTLVKMQTVAARGEARAENIAAHMNKWGNDGGPGSGPRSKGKAVVSKSDPRSKGKAVVSKSEAKAIKNYTLNDYRKINNELRNGVLDKKTSLAVKSINSGLSKLPPHEGTVFRTAFLSDKIASQYEVGKTIEEKGFTSTSSAGFDPSSAQVRPGENIRVEYHIDSSGVGKDVSKLAEFEDEKEVLFGSGTRFDITGVENKSDTHRIVRMKARSGVVKDSRDGGPGSGPNPGNGGDKEDHKGILKSAKDFLTTEGAKAAIKLAATKIAENKHEIVASAVLAGVALMKANLPPDVSDQLFEIVTEMSKNAGVNFGVARQTLRNTVDKLITLRRTAKDGDIVTIFDAKDEVLEKLLQLRDLLDELEDDSIDTEDGGPGSGPHPGHGKVKGGSAERVAMRAELKNEKDPAKRAELQQKILASMKVDHLKAVASGNPDKAAAMQYKIDQYASKYGYESHEASKFASLHMSEENKQKLGSALAEHAKSSGEKLTTTAPEATGASSVGALGSPTEGSKFGGHAPEQSLQEKVAAAKALAAIEKQQQTEKNAVTTLTKEEKSAVADYTGSAYRAINAGLRSGVLEEHQWQQVDRINSALGKLPDYKGEVKRQAMLTAEQFGAYQVGKIVEERGFTSTSTKKDWSWHVTGTDFIINSKTGKDIEKLSLHGSTEKEVLFRSGTRFRITKREGKKVYMEEVGGRTSRDSLTLDSIEEEIMSDPNDPREPVPDKFGGGIEGAPGMKPDGTLNFVEEDEPPTDPDED